MEAILFPSLPERRAIVQIEADEASVGLCRPSKFQTAAGRFLTHRSDQAGNVQYAHTLFAEDTGSVKIRNAQGASDFARAIIPHSGRPEAKAGIGNVELVT